MALSIRDQMRLRIADSNRGPWFQRAGRVRHELGESETALWVRVDQLLGDPAAVEAMPQAVARLRRKREAQAGVRSGRRAAVHAVHRKPQI